MMMMMMMMMMVMVMVMGGVLETVFFFMRHVFRRNCPGSEPPMRLNFLGLLWATSSWDYQNQGCICGIGLDRPKWKSG